MKRLLAVFTRNWSLKLLALVLALVVFYVVRGSIRSPRPRFSPLAPAVPVPPAEPPAGR
ncbi:MAG: hypothetical protein PUE68_04335 [Kiritimatiellae bacterium]|nr:hypothetical protein [Kiritimatiellia bacterium]